MIVEFTVNESFDILSQLAAQSQVPILSDKLTLPPWLGKGYIKKINLDQNFKFVLHHYTLAQELILKRLPSQGENKLVSIVFNSFEIPSKQSSDQNEAIAFLRSNSSAIQISSSNFGTQSLFPSGSKVHFAVVGIDSSLLKSILQINSDNSCVLKNIFGSKQPFFIMKECHMKFSSLSRNWLKLTKHMSYIICFTG
ncbi:hypothetical protein [Sphingobacterium athyrii]|uniref:Uncharacterized protein n=1 Tax=Sphingobacterium athyrii TaxID=2152717 RepID=A0A363NW75_9SPHI|nr:hypothetical protein [Sphingobacterium athyrii]PUV25039.1 hypothetical protein DCO56_08845 [Sphingobacterium athyrii]